MRAGVILLCLVLGGAALAMYATAWRHGGASAEERELASAPALGGAGSFVSALLSDDGDEEAAAPEPVPTAKARPPVEPEVWYQWTDERGSVRFANSLGEVPAKWRKSAGRIEMSPIKVVATRAPARRAPARAAKAAPEPGGMFDQMWGGEGSSAGDVIVYSTSWCGACTRAKAHLDERGVDYVDKDIEEDAEAEEEFLQKSGGRRGVPLLDVYGQIMHGFSATRLDQLLQRRS